VQTPSYDRKSAKIHAARHLCFAGPAFILRRVTNAGYVPWLFRFRFSREADFGAGELSLTMPEIDSQSTAKCN